MDTFLAQLRKQLQQPLPGPAIQARMSPLQQQDERFAERKRPGVRQGSVLILLYPEKNQLYLPFMERPVYKGHHSGQISFPGGKREPEDPDPIFTALREAEEEIGVDPQKVEILGTLTELYIPPSNYQVLPVVGWTPSRPEFVPDPVEVATIIEAPLAELRQKGSIRQTQRLLSNGLRLQTPFYDVQQHEVWGATAMMLSEFLEVVRRMEG